MRNAKTLREKIEGRIARKRDDVFFPREFVDLGGEDQVLRAFRGLVRDGELARLAQSGLVTVRAVGNQKHYQANPESPLFAELSSIAQKTVGLAEPLRDALHPFKPQIFAAFVHGSVAKRLDVAASDIDLMVVSDSLSYGDVFATVEAASTRLGRSVNPTILTRKELAKRVKADNAFVSRVMSQPKIWLIGGEDDLRI